MLDDMILLHEEREAHYPYPLPGGQQRLEIVHALALNGKLSAKMSQHRH